MDDVLGNAIDALHVHLHLRGDGHGSLPKNMEASEQKNNVMKEDGASFGNDVMRDRNIACLVSRNK